MWSILKKCQQCPMYHSCHHLNSQNSHILYARCPACQRVYCLRVNTKTNKPERGKFKKSKRLFLDLKECTLQQLNLLWLATCECGGAYPWLYIVINKLHHHWCSCSWVYSTTTIDACLLTQPLTIIKQWTLHCYSSTRVILFSMKADKVPVVKRIHNWI